MSGWFTVAPDHPSLPGHFPGNPVVPGVVLLDKVTALIEQTGWRVTEFPGVRFLRPVRAGDRVELVWSETRFSGSVNGTVVLEGTFVADPKMSRDSLV